jgi:Cys-tRNA(Pro)/Cys-tRNA(Cys) deacylase
MMPAPRTAKTNAVRILEREGLAFELLGYDSDGEAKDAVTVAGILGVDPDRVFKTLVARSAEGEVVVFCVPGPVELDLKKAARAAGTKKIEMVAVKELFDLTGYVRGGCSPIGLKKAYPVYIDETSRLWDWILVSAGQRGLQIKIDPGKLADVVDATLSDII